jgi:hypothetical protein
MQMGFVTREIMIHDMAQGGDETDPWLVTFCPLCNAGALFSPRVDGKILRFEVGGIYNAMAILRDQDTGSYWDHIHGAGLHGAMQGKQLERLATMRHMYARDALEAYPNIEIYRSPMDAEDEEDVVYWEKLRSPAQPEWSTRVANSVMVEDARRSRFDMGLGIWTAHTARYYPSLIINAADNIVFDTFEGRSLLIYVDPNSSSPDAFFTDAASATWLGERLRLNNRQYVEHGTLYSPEGKQIQVERPQQLFQRWYGFSTLFRGCEIYELPPKK